MQDRWEHDFTAGIPAYAVVRDAIRNQIVAGRLRPGSRLTIRSLVDQFGISQMPIREALQALEGEGLITMLPHRGATVLQLDPKRVGDIYDVRGAIESLLMRLSVPNLTNAAMAELTAIHEEFKKSRRLGDQQAVFALNSRFHSLIYRHANNPEAQAVYERYTNILGALRDRFGFSEARMYRIEAEHAQIIEALRAQDEVQLENVVRAHMEGAKADLVSQMQEELRAAAADTASHRIRGG